VRAEEAARAAIEAERSARGALAALEAVAREAAGVLLDRDEPHGIGDVAGDSARLTGANLREMIARVALKQHAIGVAVHWSAWYAWLREAGFEAGGKKPEATFQTQLTRSPLVRRADQDGYYVLDLERFQRERSRLHRLHDQLSQLPPADQLALLGDHRLQRRQIQNDIARAERAVEEIMRILAREPPPESPGLEAIPEEAISAWLRVIDARAGGKATHR
jgi:hypothetical protein